MNLIFLHISDLEIGDDFSAHNGLEFLRANFSCRDAKLAIARHIHEVGFRHMDAVVLQTSIVIFIILFALVTMFTRL